MRNDRQVYFSGNFTTAQRVAQGVRFVIFHAHVTRYWALYLAALVAHYAFVA